MPSDYGNEQTDKELKRLEEKIHKEYEQAAKEVQAKFYAHMKDFERKDAKMKARMDAGKITKTEYQNWRTNQMLTGQRMNALYESLAKDLVNADQIAAGMINDSLPDVYVLNMNYSTYKIEHTTEIDTNFTLYDRKTVENLMKDNPRIIPRLTEKQAARIKKDELWNRQHLVSAVAQGILQGEGIPDIAKRLQTVAAMDDNAATRNARTYITAAQNKGRIDSYERAEKLGIKTNKKWIATLDDRTRVEHRHLDGVSIPYSDVFKMDGYEIEYPGDPSAEPEMIYNCRCTLVDDIKNWPYNDERNDEKLGDMTYEQWKHAKDKPGKEGTTKQDAEIRAEQTKAQEETKEEWMRSVEFTPAESIKEAEEYANKMFVQGGGFNLTGKEISYNGIDLDIANAINKRLTEIYENFNVDKLSSLESYGKKNKKVYNAGNNKDACMVTTNFGNIGINKEIVGNMQTLAAYQKEGQDGFQYVIDNIEYLSGALREKAEIYKEAGRSLVGNEIEDMITHEIGHHLSYGSMNKEFAEIGKSEEWKEYAKHISGYANSSFGEYIAESFNAYYKNEIDILQPEMIKVFDGLRRR